MQPGDIRPLPAGGWSVNDWISPPAYHTTQFRTQGYQVDTKGRPLHPNLSELLQNDGVLTGRGAFHHFGPNFTADPVVIAGDAMRQVLLIQRRDTGRWALPGGFREEVAPPNFTDATEPLDARLEPAVTTAVRELEEETGLRVSAKDASWLGHLVCEDMRTTAHAWAETDGFAWHIPETVPVLAGDDAADAQWFDVDSLPDGMMSHHLELIRRAESHDTVVTPSASETITQSMKRLGKEFIVNEENVHEIIRGMGNWMRDRADGHGLILGLSGGVDSAVVARLAQTAGLDLKVLLLPDGASGMNSDVFRHAVQLADSFNMQREIIDISAMTEAMMLSADHTSVAHSTDEHRHLAALNIAPRVRAGVLYQVGQLEGRRVVGTDNLAEQITGYFTKFGDGAYDLNPLRYCTKGEVYLLARALGVNDEIIETPPSAGLVDGQTDEAELGMTYAQLDSWILKGTCGDTAIDQKIQSRYDATAHKRTMPYAFTTNERITS
jgi:NAD+ synthase